MVEGKRGEREIVLIENYPNQCSHRGTREAACSDLNSLQRAHIHVSSWIHFHLQLQMHTRNTAALLQPYLNTSHSNACLCFKLGQLKRFSFLASVQSDGNTLIQSVNPCAPTCEMKSAVLVGVMSEQHFNKLKMSSKFFFLASVGHLLRSDIQISNTQQQELALNLCAAYYSAEWHHDLPIH